MMSDGSLSDLTAQMRQTFCEGWLEHKAHRPNGYKYEKLYALLEDNVIYIFKSDKPSKENQIGNLTIETNAVFTLRPGGNQSKGFKFDLHTGQRVNRFKTRKFSERELWRGYVIGISKGDIPKDLDLLDTEIEKMRRDITSYHTGETCDNRKSIVSSDSGIKSLDPSRVTGSSSNSGETRSTHSGRSSISTTVNQGSPTVVHKFYNDHNREQTPPSWFISHCSREFAEKILERANSMDQGNTLMRESTSFLSNGSYVISKILIDKRTGNVSYDHYEVFRSAVGYEIRVENSHAPMKCLSDVMQWFVRQSGSNTQPLTVNDLKVLGQDVPGYASRIASRISVGEPWAWPPPDQGEGEPMPDYDEPEFPRPPNGSDAKRPPSSSSHNTVSPGILRNSQPPSPGDRKSVGWSSVIKTPQPHNTFAGSRAVREPTPSLTEIQQRNREAAELQKFDHILVGFETGFQLDTPYMNTPARLNEKPDYHFGPKSAPVPLVPPPAPHAQPQARLYVNEVKPSSSQTPQLRNSTSFPSSLESSTTTSAASTPSSFLRKTSLTAADTPSSVTSAASQRHGNITKSFSEVQLKNLASPNSPSAFPTWDNKKPSVGSPARKSSVPNQSSPREVANDMPNHSDQLDSGIDQNDPGGVSTLRSKFENSASKVSQGTPQLASKASQGIPQLANKTSQGTPQLAKQDTGEPDVTGLDPSFKNKLEEMLKGGSTVGPAAGKEPRKMPPLPNAHRQTLHEDNEYQELPEIVPDAVTYVNERYNVNDHDNT